MSRFISLAIFYVTFSLGASNNCKTPLTVHQVSSEDTRTEHAVELIEQFRSQRDRMVVLSRINNREYHNRWAILREIKNGKHTIFFRNETRPLAMFVVRLSKISELNNDYLTISHTERLLEEYFIELQTTLDAVTWSKIVLHRWSGFYILSPLTPDEFQRDVLAPVKAKVRDYLKARKSEAELHRQNPQFKNWETFLDQSITLDVVPFAPERFPNYNLLSAPELFQKMVIEAHLTSAFSQISYRRFTTAQYGDWRNPAVDRVRRINRFLETKNISKYEVFRHLQAAIKEDMWHIFTDWLLERVEGKEKRGLFSQLINDFEKLTEDFKVSSFLQYSEDQRLKNSHGIWREDFEFSQGMTMFPNLPESSLERRRILFDRAMREGGYVIATDLHGLGVIAKMEMFEWFIQGANQQEIPFIFKRMNQLLGGYFKRLNRLVEQATKAAVYTYVAGDDAFFILGKVDEAAAARAAQALRAHPLDLSSEFSGVPPIQLYSSDAVAFPKGVASEIAVGAAKAKARDLVNIEKKRFKDDLLSYY